ncbi:GNAT family N-acetyltransferase [Roseisolibacter sp. H3M3-2]|uniref:GNAT family N-acetyltransferase n=1 Tax=Roseisolibacter sp. H3M3-2 TaxID=3031323 RepID=UPI0023DBB41E|nr:GNAT family N-acetyltransferase [Roseisolibacter sp. H3M3-2]MDF1503805.1 GNAT family N-acetyltransferase [Roseisolibacter sp. H3M3-2]
MSSITLATPSDAALLAAFAERTFRDTYAPPYGPCEPADVEAYVAEYFGVAVQGRELADPAMRVLLARDAAGGLAGYAQVRCGARPEGADGYAPVAGGDRGLVAGADAELARLYVDRPWHGGGLAARLFDAARGAAAACGAEALWFSVYRKNARALAFYRKRGVVPIAAATFTMGREVQDDWLLAVPTRD